MSGLNDNGTGGGRLLFIEVLIPINISNAHENATYLLYNLSNIKKDTGTAPVHLKFQFLSRETVSLSALLPVMGGGVGCQGTRKTSLLPLLAPYINLTRPAPENTRALLKL